MVNQSLSSRSKILLRIYFSDAFDREYQTVFQKLNDKQRQLISRFDKCPTLAAVMCRRLFSPLEL